MIVFANFVTFVLPCNAAQVTIAADIRVVFSWVFVFSWPATRCAMASNVLE